jgi:hypothetical protein
MLGYFSVFMDNGIIHTKRCQNKTEEQHLARHYCYVHKIFDILSENNLYVKPKKYAFKQQEIKYLGVIVGKGQL